MYAQARTLKFQSAATPARFRFPAFTYGGRCCAWQVSLFLNIVTNAGNPL